MSPVTLAARAGNATGAAPAGRLARCSSTATACPSTGAPRASRVTVPSLTSSASQDLYQSHDACSGLRSATAMRSARAAARLAASPGRSRSSPPTSVSTTARPDPVARSMAASRSASDTVSRLVPAGWRTPVMPMIALRSASSGAATLIRPASWPPVRSRDLRAAASSRLYSGPRYRSSPDGLIRDPHRPRRRRPRRRAS